MSFNSTRPNGIVGMATFMSDAKKNAIASDLTRTFCEEFGAESPCFQK